MAKEERSRKAEVVLELSKKARLGAVEIGGERRELVFAILELLPFSLYPLLSLFCITPSLPRQFWFSIHRDPCLLLLLPLLL